MWNGWFCPKLSALDARHRVFFHLLTDLENAMTLFNVVDDRFKTLVTVGDVEHANQEIRKGMVIGKNDGVVDIKRFITLLHTSPHTDDAITDER